MKVVIHGFLKDQKSQNSKNKCFYEHHTLLKVRNKIYGLMGQFLGFSAQWAKTCKNYNFQRVEMVKFSKIGLKGWIKLIQGLKWCIFQTRIKNVNFLDFGPKL